MNKVITIGVFTALVSINSSAIPFTADAINHDANNENSALFQVESYIRYAEHLIKKAESLC